MVWRLAKRSSEDGRVFAQESELGQALDEAMQRRMRRAYNEMGEQRFRRSATEEDFHLTRAGLTTAAREEENWGESDSAEVARATRFWEWPDEPATEAAPMSSSEITGLEIEEHLSADEVRERASDLQAWEQEGQTWWGAMTVPAQARMQHYLHENKRVNDAVATAVALLQKEGDEGPKYEDFGGAITKKRDHPQPGRLSTWSARKTMVVDVGHLPGVYAGIDRAGGD